jgi:hypothetical protein
MLYYELETEDDRLGRLTAILAPTEARGAACPERSFATGSRFCWNRLALHHDWSEVSMTVDSATSPGPCCKHLPEARVPALLIELWVIIRSIDCRRKKGDRLVGLAG